MAFGTTSVAAFAQDDPTATSTPAETSTPQSTPQPTPETPSNEPPPPPATTGSVSGVLYADQNRNGRQDAEEAVSGGKVVIHGGGDGSRHETTSNAAGEFAFADLAPGTYQPTYELADGWAVHHTKVGGDLITVTANQKAEVLARAERRYDEQLKATATLDQGSYRHPASATVTVRLTNTTDRPISGIRAACDREDSPHLLGRGAGWNVLKGNGLELAAGEERTITIVEDIPLAAREKGSVALNCDFAPFVDWNTDGPAVHDEATVTGNPGYTLVFGDDRNADSRLDAGEEISGVKVLLLNPKTGEQVTEGTSDKNGKVEFEGLAAGDYRAVLLGSWGLRDAGQEHVRVTEQGGFGYRFLKRASPADLRGTVKFDKPRYESHELVRMELTVKNIGGQTAERARLDWSPYELEIPEEQWGDFRPRSAGVQIPAGESRTFNVVGTVRSFSNGRLTVWGGLDFVGRPNPHHSGFTGSFEVVPTTGTIGGVVYTDKNRNGQQDPGEAAADAVVDIGGGAPYQSIKITTDAEGRFSAKDIPSGWYWVNYTLTGGWIVHHEGEQAQIRVEPGKPAELTVRAERPYREKLRATVVLDRATYAIGDDAKVTVTLTNTDDRAISGVQAACNRVGDGNHLGGTITAPMPPSWGDLRHGTPGVTLNPGETKTFVITEKVPAAARSKRKVIVACDFAPNPGYNTDGPFGYDWASVPGGFGELEGPLFHDRNGNWRLDEGEAITRTRVLMMTDKVNGFLVAETVSDAQGNVHFKKVPPGDFWLVIDGPWVFEGEWGGHVQVLGEGVARVQLTVVPGPPPGPGPGEPHEAPPGSDVDTGPAGALAKTGASVLGLGVLAVLLVAFGIGARVAGRRRTV